MTPILRLLALAMALIVGGVGGFACSKESPANGGRGGDAGPVGSGGSSGAAGAAAGSGGNGTGGTVATDAPLVIDVGVQLDGAGTFQPDASGSPKHCVGLRNCVTACQNDAACKQRCLDTAPAAAKTAYAEITTCSSMACAETDVECRCRRECLDQGACLDIVETCRGFEADPDVFCEDLCH